MQACTKPLLCGLCTGEYVGVLAGHCARSHPAERGLVALVLFAAARHPSSRSQALWGRSGTQSSPSATSRWPGPAELPGPGQAAAECVAHRIAAGALQRQRLLNPLTLGARGRPGLPAFLPPAPPPPAPALLTPALWRLISEALLLVVLALTAVPHKQGRLSTAADPSQTRGPGRPLSPSLGVVRSRPCEATTVQLISLLVSQAQAWEAGGLLRRPRPTGECLGTKSPW